MNVDSRGVTRGCCNVPGCSCSSYSGASTGGMRCDKCEHPPVRHSKSSMTAPSGYIDSAFVQSISDEESPPSLSLDGSSSDDEAAAQPETRGIIRFIHSLPSPFQKKPASPPPRRKRPQPHKRIPVVSQDAWSGPSLPPKPLPTCRYPNCDKPPFFDLNTQDESPYCSEHRFSAPPVPIDTEQSLPVQFDSAVHVRDGGRKGPYPPRNLPMEDGLSPPFYYTTPTGQHRQSEPDILPQRLTQTMFPSYLPRQAPPQSLFHHSQSTPSFQHTQLMAQSLSPATLQPAQPPVPLLPDGVRCKYPLCNKSRHQESNGKVHEFCGRTHAREFQKLNGGAPGPAVPVGMKCKTPNCSRLRRKREDGAGFYDYCGRSCRDGTFRTSQSAPGEPCSLPGCTKPKYVDPANGRVHDYCGRTHANEAQAKGIAPQVCTLKLLSPLEMAPIQAHFQKEWAKQKGACPPITCVFQVTNSQLESRWNAYKQRLPARLQGAEKYFHGTKLTCDIVNTRTTCTDKHCGICGISKVGMYRECIRKNINFQRFGHGFYFAPNSSKCHDYTQGVSTHRAMLLVDILPGKKHEILTTKQDIKGPPDGCHSVFGKPGQSLNYPELVVYNPDCVMPRYIVVYTLNGVHKIA